MKKNTKLKYLSFLAVSALALGVAALNNDTVEASAATPTTFEMDYGAAVRLTGDDTTGYGIRYTATIDASEYVSTDKYYVMIIPSGWIQKYSLTGENCDYYDVLVNQNGKVWQGTDEERTINIMETVPKKDGNKYTINGSITNVKYENSYRTFFGLAYKTDADGNNRVYAEFTEGDNVRSISEVASKALNDKEENYTTTQVDFLNKVIKSAYNAEMGKASTDEQVDLPKITAESVKLALEKDKTYQLSAPSGIPADIGIDVEWKTSDKTQVEVSQDGLITVKADNAVADITASVLGTEYTMANCVAENVILNDFSKENSYKDLRTLTNGTYSGEWSESVTLGGETRYGVVKAPYDPSYRKFYVTFDKQLGQVSAIGGDFDYISAWVYLETEATGTAMNTSWSMVGDTFNVNQWQEIKITKEFIEASGSQSFWSYYCPATYDSVLDYFWYCHARDGEGIYKDRPLIRLGGDFTSAANLYIDCVSVVRTSVEEYVVPNSGTEFAVPTAKLMDIDGTLLDIQTTAEVTYKASETGTTSDVTVEDGKFSVKSGIYTLKYIFTNGGSTIEKEESFSVARAPMAENMLEDFDAPESLKNFWNRNAHSMSVEQKAENVWLGSHADGSGVEKTGVAVVNGYGNTYALKFNRTAAELNALGLDENDTISVTFMFEGITYGVAPTIFGVTMKTAYPNAWYTYDISVADIIAANTSLDAFLTNAGSDGSGVVLDMGVTSKGRLYIAEISFTKNA